MVIENWIINHFPHKKPRKNQYEIIQEIYSAIEQGYKYITLEAGTGTGKSAIATTIANYFSSEKIGQSFIITATKQLQKQYQEKPYNWIVCIGRHNFKCRYNDYLRNSEGQLIEPIIKKNNKINCENGTCKNKTLLQDWHCPHGINNNNPFIRTQLLETSENGNLIPVKFCRYWNQKKNAINSDKVVLNYNKAILEHKYIPHFSQRKLIIFDEAHNLEKKIIDYVGIQISDKNLKKYNISPIPKEVIESEDYTEWTQALQIMIDEYSKLNIESMPIKEAEHIMSIINKLIEIKYLIEENPVNWIIKYYYANPESNEEILGVEFKPITIFEYAKEYLLTFGEICIFMSATILDHDYFSQCLGLRPQEVYNIKCPTPFSYSNRPIIFKTDGKLSKRYIDETKPKTIPLLLNILNQHTNEKGLIHTHNYELTNYIIENIKSNRFITHNTYNREEALNKFKKNKANAVLVSPSMSEGLDLPYDNCRFQIIYKIPYPYLGDELIKKRSDYDYKFIHYETVKTLLQTYGRIMRSENDYGKTYIIDGSLLSLLSLDTKMGHNMIPSSLKEALPINLKQFKEYL